MLLNRQNAPWYSDQERDVLNKVAFELVAAGLPGASAADAVHLAWFAGASAEQLRRAVAAHRDPIAGEPAELAWQ